VRFDRYSEMVQDGKDMKFLDTWPVWLRGLNTQSVVDWYAKKQVRFYSGLQQKDQWHKATRRAMRILIELKRAKLRGGDWPQRLEDLTESNLSVGQLTDPVSGRPFVYERMGESFRFYSVGWNQRDDKGIMNTKTGKDDRLYWPPLHWEDFSEEDIENEGKTEPFTEASRL